jgi:hypothetical protein
MFVKGQKAWNKGKKMLDKTKKKISIKKIGKTAWNKGIKRWWKSPTEFKNGQTCGEKNVNWKGGRSRGYKTGYYSSEYKKWRLSVFERDMWRCQVCGQVGGYLTAHHIKSFAFYPELRLDPNNGITLCEECHKMTDNYKGRAKKCSIDKSGLTR